MLIRGTQPCKDKQFLDKITYSNSLIDNKHYQSQHSYIIKLSTLSRYLNFHKRKFFLSLQLTLKPIIALLLYGIDM